MSEFQEAIEKAKREKPDITLGEFAAEFVPAAVGVALGRDCEGVAAIIDQEIANVRERISELNLLAANIDRGIYPTDPLMAYGPITKEEKWVYDMIDNLVRNEERNIEILERAKATAKEKCK